MSLSSRIKVAVLRGGPSHDYEQSFASGAHVLAQLKVMEDAYEPLDIFISRDGEWHLHGRVLEPHRALRYADVAWNALHGSYGEDGQIQRILESLQLPFTGSGAMASAMAMNKEVSKNVFQSHLLLTPKHELLTQEDFTEERVIEIFRTYLHPVVVKPSRGSSSLGVVLAHSFHELGEAIKNAFKHSPRVLVEEHIRGKDASCLVVERARGEDIHAFIPSGSLAARQKREVESMAKTAHSLLGLRHYSSSDFIITPKGNVYIIETNALPRLSDAHHEESLARTAWKPHTFVDHVIKLTLER